MARECCPQIPVAPIYSKLKKDVSSTYMLFLDMHGSAATQISYENLNSLSRHFFETLKEGGF